nr:uncharacterized protein CTRU02_10638 [Colletotrichum truncatum]KAF6786939.1 integral membrane protein [Colletotrichum truncatum]
MCVRWRNGRLHYSSVLWTGQTQRHNQQSRLCYLRESRIFSVHHFRYCSLGTSEDIHCLVSTASQQEQVVFSVLMGIDRLRRAVHYYGLVELLPVLHTTGRLLEQESQAKVLQHQIIRRFCLGQHRFLAPTFTSLAVANLSLAFNIFTDVCFATLPIPIIWVLQMKLRTRVYLIVVLSLGYFAVIMGIIKTVYQIAQPSSKDGTFYQSIQFWGFLQLNLGIIAACAPALKPLVGRALKISSSRRYNSNNLYENRYPTGRTGRTGNGTSHARRQGYMEQGSQGAPEFELEDGPFTPGTDYYKTSVKGGNHPAAVAVYKKKNSFGSRGSEDMILESEYNVNDRGIMRTTEVSIQR